MSSKNTSIITSNLNKHITRIKSEKKGNISKFEEIENFEKEKLAVLTEAISIFDIFLSSIENNTAETKTWRNTLKQARAFLTEYSEDDK